MNFREDMKALRALSDDYYQGRISFSEYRAQRSKLLVLIDEELNGVKVISTNNIEEDEVSASFVDKALSFLKIDQQQDN